MILLLTLIIFYLTNNLLHASSWVKKEGELFLSNSLYFYNAKKYYDKDYNLREMPCEYDKKEFQIYTEYGFKKNTTLTFKVPYYIIECDKSENYGIGDLELGFIQNIQRRDFSSISFYSQVIIPTGYSIDEELRLGYNRVGLEGGLLYGKSFNWGYIDTALAYRYYLGYPSSQIRGNILSEYNLTNIIKLFSNLEVQIGLNDGETKEIGNNLLLNPNYELYKIYLGTRINLNKLSFIIGYQDTIYGKDTGKGNGFYFSIWFNY